MHFAVMGGVLPSSRSLPAGSLDLHHLLSTRDHSVHWHHRVLGAGSHGSNGSPVGNTKEVGTHTQSSADAQTHALQLPLLKLLEVALQDIMNLNTCLDYCGNSHLQ